RAAPATPPGRTSGARSSPDLLVWPRLHAWMEFYPSAHRSAVRQVTALALAPCVTLPCRAVCRWIHTADISHKMLFNKWLRRRISRLTRLPNGAIFAPLDLARSADV